MGNIIEFLIWRTLQTLLACVQLFAGLDGLDSYMCAFTSLFFNLIHPLYYCPFFSSILLVKNVRYFHKECPQTLLACVQLSAGLDGLDSYMCAFTAKTHVQLNQLNTVTHCCTSVVTVEINCYGDWSTHIMQTQFRAGKIL